MTSLRSESLLVVPLFPVLVLGAFPVLLLMGFLGFAGLAILGALMVSSALTVGLDADREFTSQTAIGASVDRTQTAAFASSRDAMVRFAKATGLAGALLVAVAVTGIALAG